MANRSRPCVPDLTHRPDRFWSGRNFRRAVSANVSVRPLLEKFLEACSPGFLPMSAGTTRQYTAAKRGDLLAKSRQLLARNNARKMCLGRCDEPDHRILPPKAQDSEEKFLENQRLARTAAFFAGHCQLLAANADLGWAGSFPEVLQRRKRAAAILS